MRGRLFQFLLLSILLFSIVSSSQTYTTDSQDRTTQPSKLPNPIVYIQSSYISHEPIYISSNDDFLLLGFQGNGTLNDPYLIDNLNISISEDDTACIYITNTTAAFEIRNCFLSNPLGVGIHLYLFHWSSPSFANLSNNKINDCDVGINLDWVDDVLVQMNQIMKNSLGLYVHRGDRCNFFYNAFINNTLNVHHDDGIYRRHYYEYNYWSNHYSDDINSDGIGDYPYSFEEYYVDYHPLVQNPSSYGDDNQGPTTILSFGDLYETDEEFEIAVDVMDVNGVTEVYLRYIIDDSSWVYVNMSSDIERYFSELDESGDPEATIPYWYSPKLSFASPCTITFQVQSKDKLGNEALSLNESILIAEDLYGPIFGYSWEFFLTETIGFVVTTGGSNYTYSHTFSNSVYDPSGIDTILLYYYVGPIDEWYLNKDQILEQVSWIQYDIVSYDVNTNRCSTTLHFNPPIYSDPIYAFYWANDTFGRESRGGLQCYHYDGMTPYLLYEIEQNIGIFVIAIIGMIGIIFIIVRRRMNTSIS